MRGSRLFTEVCDKVLTMLDERLECMYEINVQQSLRTALL